MLKESDLKLLNYLYHNSRESYSKIAKNTKLSREQVRYKIEKYISEGLIRKFITIFNFQRLGYNYIALFMLRFRDNQSKEEFIHSLSDNKNCMSWGKVYSKYDIFSNFIFKDEQDFTKFLASIKNIDEYMLIRPTYTALYPLKLFGSKFEEINMTLISEPYKLDQKEVEILRLLQEDNRIKIVDMASKTGLSSELTLYKLKKLKQEKIILGSRIQFNMKKLGYFFTILLINADMSNQVKKKIITYSKQTKNINSLIIQPNQPNYIIQIFHKSEEELRKSVEDLKRILEERCKIEIIPLDEDEPEVNTLPFL